MNKKEWRDNNKAHIKSYNKDYWKKWYLKNKEKRKEQNKLERKNNAEYYRKYRRVFIKFPDQIPKIKARKLLLNAVKSGKITKQDCAIPDCTSETEAHHPDYSKPLEVIWLCKKHHMELHHNN